MVVGETAEETDVLVVGAGSGGYVAAIRAAQLGKSVILVNKDELGGVCLHQGCIPSKALLHVAELYHQCTLAGDMGITGSVSVDLGKLQAWKRGVVDRLDSGIRRLCKLNGVEIINGWASFQSSDYARIETGGEAVYVKFKSAIIDTGSKPVEFPGVSFDEKVILSSKGILELEELPKRLVCIGGGFISVEMSIFYAKLGSKVTILHRGKRLLKGTDPELVELNQKWMQTLGIVIKLGTSVEKIARASGGAKIYARGADGKVEELEADAVLIAIGRKPNTEGFGLERTKVQLDERGFIKVDERMRTTDSRIYAIGDVVGEPMLATKAFREGKVAAEVIAGLPSAMDYFAMPVVIFSDEIAYVGLSEEQAKERGIDVVVGRFPFSALGRAVTMNKPEGLVKVVAEKGSQRILGVHIFGPQASSLISEATLAIEMGATLEDVASTLHPHPTLPEAVMEACEEALGRSVHLFRKGRTSS